MQSFIDAASPLVTSLMPIAVALNS